jgi:hypothetical protein
LDEQGLQLWVDLDSPLIPRWRGKYFDKKEFQEGVDLRFPIIVLQQIYQNPTTNFLIPDLQVMSTRVFDPPPLDN